jgi:ribosome recycling factor
MKKTLEKLKTELSTIRTGRANAAVLDQVKVEICGAFLPINQVAGINIPDARTIEVKPWDVSQLGSIEKAILKSDIGLLPVNDGKLIRLSIPTLTEERRKEIVKTIGKTAEDFKIAVRNERRILVDSIKKLEKSKDITEDDKKKFENEAQKITDLYVKQIDDVVFAKEKEIMKI